jgi:myo-inositol catabolism protein IolS
MQYRQLGQTGLEVSVIGLGTWQFAGEWAWGPQEEADSITAVHTALDYGINFFDTAEGYGNGESEAILGRALKGRREEAVIATKVSASHLEADELVAACERSLKHLDTDRIDLYQVHWPNWEIPIEEPVGALQRLQQQGKIRAFGVSNFGRQDLPAFIKAAGSCTSNQLPYSLLWRSIEFELQAICVQNKTSILCYSSLAQGLLTGKFASADDVPEGRARTRNFSTERSMARHGQPGCEKETFKAIDQLREVSTETGIPMGELALAWLYRQPGVTSALVGGRTSVQVERNARAGDRQMDSSLVKRLSEITRPVKELLGPVIDPYAEVSRIR